MKTILIATDFSPASRNASLYGIKLGKAFDARIILFSAYSVPHRMPSLNVGISEFGIMKDTEDKLRQEVLFLKTHTTLPIDILCDKGIPEVAINNISKEKNIDFIVIGMKGAGRNIKKVFGSTVTELIRITDLPVLVIPEYASFVVPDKIIFASTMDEDTDLHSLKALIEFTTFFKSKLFVVKVIKHSDEDLSESTNISPELRKAFDIIDSEFEYPVDTDVSHALSECISKHDANLLVMVPKEHDWLELLFLKSETKKMIFLSHIPILVFPQSRFVETD